MYGKCCVVGKSPHLLMRVIVKSASHLRHPYSAMVDGVIYDNQSPTKHAEIMAVEGAKGYGLTMYTTAEPCPMCMAAIVWSGKFSKVVYGTDIPTLIALGHLQSDIRAQTVIDSFRPARFVALVQQDNELTDPLYA